MTVICCVSGVRLYVSMCSVRIFYVCGGINVQGGRRVFLTFVIKHKLPSLPEHLWTDDMDLHHVTLGGVHVSLAVSPATDGRVSQAFLFDYSVPEARIQQTSKFLVVGYPEVKQRQVDLSDVELKENIYTYVLYSHKQKTSTMKWLTCRVCDITLCICLSLLLFVTSFVTEIE